MNYIEAFEVYYLYLPSIYSLIDHVHVVPVSRIIFVSSHVIKNI